MTETVQQRIRSLEQHLSLQPRSPLFAQLAAYYLDAGRTRDALDLCDKGLSYYPFFSTGHLIKGKALLSLNMTAEARREFEFVQSSFQGLSSLKRLLHDLPSAEIETLVAPAEVQPQPQTGPPAKHAPAEQSEPTTEDSSPEQILSHFTEAAAETPEALFKTLKESDGTMPGESPELTTAEPSETFSFTPELPQEPQAETPLQSEDVFGLETQQEPPAGSESPISEEPPGAIFEPPSSQEQVGESFVDFAERKRGELFGLENSISLDEYLALDQPPEAIPDATLVNSEPQTGEDAFATVVSERVEPLAVEDPFATLTQQLADGFVEAPPEQVSNDPFATLTQQPVEGSAESPPGQLSDDPFAQLQQSFTEPGAEASRSAESGQERDQIAQLADKLQNAKKITPIIDLSERTPTPPSESEAPSSTGFVTPTLAEIYAKQGWYDDAIKAYKTLAFSKPAEKEKFENRIHELEELKRKQESG